MKLIKKIMVVFTAILLVMSMTNEVYAANDGKITIDNAINGEKYNLYKVFDLTYGGEGQTGATGTTATTPTAGTYTPVSYTYTAETSDEFLAALQGTSSPFTVTLVSGTTNEYSVVRKTGTSAPTDQDIVDFVKANISKLPASKKIDGEKTAANNKVEWTELAYGYYYITSTAGSFVTIDSTLKEVTVKEKNTIPTQDKKQTIGTTAPTSADGYADTEQQVQVGDKVWYQIEVTDGKGTNADIVITDTMTNGLTFNNDIKVFKGTVEVAESTDTPKTWTKTNPTGSDSFTFKVTLDKDYVATLQETDKVYIRFSATVNSAAATDTDAAKETNTSVLTYSNQSSTDSVDVFTYKVQLDKVQNEAAQYADLLGARFELYRGSVADANKVWFTKGTNDGNVPVLTVAGTGASAPVTGAFSDIRLTDNTKDKDTNSLNSSKVIFKGLDKDTYILRETEAPAGYNPAADQTIADTTLVVINGTITDTAAKIGADDTAVVSVVNNQGTELPQTGGIGTTIFHVLGGALVLGAGIILIAKKRVNS